MVEAYFDNIRSKLIKELNKSQKRICVAVYWFTNQELFNILQKKADDGIKVELIIHNDYINNSDSQINFQGLIDSGAEFYFSDDLNPMHNKFCIIDNKVLINGSYNWTYFAENKNRENIIIIKQEDKVIEAFTKEFDRLKSLTNKIDLIERLTKFELDEFNALSARDYLANDIIYKAFETGEKHIIEEAFEIAPNNIEVQKTAFDLNLTKKYKLKHSIGSSLHKDGYKIIVEKGTMIPVSSTAVVCTVFDNQKSSTATIHYGEQERASRNKQFAEMKLTGLPAKPAGQAKMKYHFTIDIHGNLRMEKFSLDNGRRQIINKKITGLLEEVLE